MTDDFIVVGPQWIPGGKASQFTMFKWRGYRDTAQGYNEVASIIIEYTDIPLQVLLPRVASAQVPSLTTWIASVIEDEDGHK